MDAATLTLRDVVSRYDTESIGPVSVAITAGDCWGLVGSNGAGKTTILRIITGLQAADAGHVDLNGSAIEPGQVAGMIEEPRFYPFLSASDNLRVICGGAPHKLAAIAATLTRVGLSDAGRRPVRHFSQGMRQRLGIARVLLSGTPMLVFDEPTNGLDPVAIRWFRGLIQDLRAEGHTLVLSSHMLHEVHAMAQKFTMLDHGSVVAEGNTSDLPPGTTLEDLYFLNVNT